MSENCSNIKISSPNGSVIVNKNADEDLNSKSDLVFNGYTENFAYFLYKDGTVQMIDRQTLKVITDKSQILEFWKRLDYKIRNNLKRP